MKKWILFFPLLFWLSSSAQQNYEWLKIKKYKTAELSDTLKENSGLTLFKDRLFTINDSGNSSEVFEIEKATGTLKNVFKTNLKNIDWEAITNDSINFYIGDFGNNSGSRKDLKIYKMPFESVINASVAHKIQEIPFFYPEQKDFTPKNLNTDFDAEAMIFLHGKIHVFTKEWNSKSTTHYLLNPESLENQAVQKVENYKTNFVVTDASYFDKKLYLVGYTKNTEVFLSIFKETEGGLFFKEKPQKYYLGTALSIGQIEGIAVDQAGVYLAGEEFITPIGKSKPRLYFIPRERLK